MSRRTGLIAIPAVPLSIRSKTRPMLRKPKGKKAYAIPVAHLDIRETMGNWRRLRKWIRSWSLGRKPVLTVGICWLRVREDNCEWKSHMGPVMAIQNGPTLVHGNADRTNQPRAQVSERRAGGSPNWFCSQVMVKSAPPESHSHLKAGVRQCRSEKSPGGGEAFPLTAAAGPGCQIFSTASDPWTSFAISRN